MAAITYIHAFLQLFNRDKLSSPLNFSKPLSARSLIYVTLILSILPIMFSGSESPEQYTIQKFVCIRILSLPKLLS